MQTTKKHSDEQKKVYIYGRHALTEALRYAPQAIRKVYLSPTMHDAKLRILITKNSVPTVRLASNAVATRFVGQGAVHQGIIAEIDPITLLVPFDTFINSLPWNMPSYTAIAVLGEIQDPHNVGAIIRSAAAFGLSGVLIPEHRQAPVTGAVVKASAGMAFRIPLVSIGNVNQTLKTLKERGFWVYGLTAKGKSIIGTEIFDAPAAFVIGNEGSGIREKTLEACDVTLSIPMHAHTESLNASTSAAVAFYEWSRKHPEAFGPTH